MANVSPELQFIMDLDLPSPYKGNVRVTDPTSKYHNKIAYVGDKVKLSIIKGSWVYNLQFEDLTKGIVVQLRHEQLSMHEPSSQVDPTHTWTRAVTAKASIVTLNQAGKN